MNKIICIVDDLDFIEKLKKICIELNSNSKIEYADKIDLNMLDNYNKVIIAEDKMVDITIVKEVIRKKGEKNFVLLVNQMNNEISRQFILTGIHIHYKNSPLYSLVNKLEGIISIENGIANARANFKKKGSKLIAVTSPAGGTGKTTIALNVADVLAQKGRRVLVVDMSIYSDVAAKLQIQYKNGLNNLVSTILQDFENVSQENKINSFKSNIVTYKKKNCSFDLLFGLTPVKAEKISNEVVEEIIKVINAFNYEIVIFDTCSSVMEMNLALMECVDTVLVVSLPDIGNGWKIILQKELYECIQVTQKCRLVVNRFSKKSGFSCKQLEKELQYPLFGLIPEDWKIGSYANSGKLISQINQKGTITYINFIAHQLDPIFYGHEIKRKRIKK